MPFSRRLASNFSAVSEQFQCSHHTNLFFFNFKSFRCHFVSYSSSMEMNIIFFLQVSRAIVVEFTTAARDFVSNLTSLSLYYELSDLILAGFMAGHWNSSSFLHTKWRWQLLISSSSSSSSPSRQSSWLLFFFHLKYIFYDGDIFFTRCYFRLATGRRKEEGNIIIFYVGKLTPNLPISHFTFYFYR